MTIHRTPRKWPGYRTHRRAKVAGRRADIVRIPGVQDRDFSTIIATAKMAVQARNQPTHDVTIDQTVLDGRDPVSVDGTRTEEGWASVFGFLGYRRVRMDDLQVRVHVRGQWSQ